MQINEAIRQLRKKLELTQDQFAQKLSIKRSLVGAYEEGRAEPRLELLHRMASMGGISVDSFLHGAIDDSPELTTKRGKDVVVVTIDHNEKDNITLVPHKAAAGYPMVMPIPNTFRSLSRSDYLCLSRVLIELLRSVAIQCFQSCPERL